MSEKEEKEPLIKEVSTFPPPKDDKGLPTIPPTLYERPAVPEINPKLREALAQPLTLADCQYAIDTITKRVVEAFEKIRKEQPQQVVPASEAIRKMQTAIDILTEYMTRGYTVQYTPPIQQQNPQSEGSFLEGLNELWDTFDRIDPELKGKMGKTLGKLFDMLNEKLGIV